MLTTTVTPKHLSISLLQIIVGLRKHDKLISDEVLKPVAEVSAKL